MMNEVFEGPVGVTLVTGMTPLGPVMTISDGVNVVGSIAWLKVAVAVVTPGRMKPPGPTLVSRGATMAKLADILSPGFSKGMPFWFWSMPLPNTSWMFGPVLRMYAPIAVCGAKLTSNSLLLAPATGITLAMVID